MAEALGASPESTKDVGLPGMNRGDPAQRGKPGALSSNERHHAEARLLQCPEDVELFFEVGEVLVAGGEDSFACEGEGGGEAVGVG